ncbi:hypothetical protein PENTCL1PPCAC_12513, partial [Pristionchus entomophagus]
NGSGRQLVEAVSAQAVLNQRDCEFVMFIRPMPLSAWVVQLRLKLAPRLGEKRIRFSLANGDWFECIGQADGSIHVTRHEKMFQDYPPHADSFHSRTQMYCLFTVKMIKKEDLMSTGPLTVSFKDARGTKKEFKIAAIKDASERKYLSCDGFLAAFHPLNLSSNTAQAAPDVTRTRITCPRGKGWTMKAEINGKVQVVKSARCAKSLEWQSPHYVDVEMPNGDLWEMKEAFYAGCFNEVGSSTCSAPLQLPCSHCAPVRLIPGNGTTAHG